MLLRYIARRIPYVIPQLFGIILVSFFMLKLIPGDPAVMMLGPMASQQSLTALREKMGLSKPLWQQFFYYIRDVVHGDLGTSWQTTRPVVEDLFQRFPATLELVTFGLLLALIIGFPLGVAAARLRSGPVRKVADYYGLLAGAMPDFWLALVLIYIFYTQLGWIAAPLGRIDMAVVPPKTVTGSLVIDSLLAGDFEALSSAFGHLVLPVLTLGVIYAGPILKMTQTMVSRALSSEFVQYAEMCGLPRRVVLRQAVRAALPTIVTIVSVLYGFLIGGAVLVEIVFSWGGAGQYAVQGVLNADVNPVLGFVVFSAVLSLIIYLMVDLIYFALDPGRDVKRMGDAPKPILAVSNLWVTFPAYRRETVRALKGIDLRIDAGEFIGLVGESGAGKTTLARAIMGLVPPPGVIERGQVVFDGRDLSQLDDRARRAMLGRELAMVIANPRAELNPVIPVGRQISNIAYYHLGISRAESDRLALEILRAVRIPDPEHRFGACAHELSGGMAQRVAIAMALICSPRLVISDDATSGLDVTVQAQVLELLQRLVAEKGAAALFITRDIAITAHFCSRIAIIYAGQIVELAETAPFFGRPAHPYSIMLLAAFSHSPELRARWTRVPNTGEAAPAGGCAFAPRCVRRQKRCFDEEPVHRQLAGGRYVRCHFPIETAAA